MKEPDVPDISNINNFWNVKPSTPTGYCMKYEFNTANISLAVSYIYFMDIGNFVHIRPHKILPTSCKPETQTVVQPNIYSYTCNV